MSPEGESDRSAKREGLPAKALRIHVRSFDVPADAIDVNGHVNNKEYLRWMEEIAIAHSTACGWTLDRYRERGASWFVRSHFVEYLRPALQGMPIRASTWVATMDRRASMRRYAFQHAGDGALIAHAETLWIYVDLGTGRPATIPDELRRDFPLVPADDADISAILGNAGRRAPG